ncbi:MAG: hypothetical protein U1D33_00075, partial [bacterium]|nr:hypothetical protein [bacterium]
MEINSKTFMFKKSTILAAFLVFSVVAVTVPLRASAQSYNGELVFPNTRVVPDYASALSDYRATGYRATVGGQV